MKALKRRTSRDMSADSNDPSSTPITNYKNRRKLMQENKIKAKEKLLKHQAGEDISDVHGSVATNSGSFIGSVTSSFNKSKNKPNANKN